MAAGIIYILVTPANRKLLKIGKTTRTAEERAIEVSNGSGVPAPFWVVYDAEVADCDEAESLIHARLINNRYHRGREFFELPLKEAITVITEIVSQVNSKHELLADNDDQIADNDDQTIEVEPAIGQTASIEGMIQILGPSPISIKPGASWGTSAALTIGSFYITDTYITYGEVRFELPEITSVQVFERDAATTNATEPHYALVINTVSGYYDFYDYGIGVISEVFRILTTTR
jgi:hypothetical protein